MVPAYFCLSSQDIEFAGKVRRCLQRTPQLEAAPKRIFMKSQIILSFSHVASEIWRSLGKLDQAKGCLTDCYSIIMAKDANPFLTGNYAHRYQIVCAFIDIHCALEENHDADLLFKKEIERLPTDGRLSKAFRRLQVSSLDIDIA